MPASKAQQKAVAKYELNNYDKFLVRVSKGRKEKLQDYAAAVGQSLNGYVVQAVDERIERDNSKGADNNASNGQ